jgi:hypothetical protein
VGGRKNRNRVIDNTDKSGQGKDLGREEGFVTNNFVLGHEKLSEREIELNERIRQLEEKLAAKKERTFRASARSGG